MRRALVWGCLALALLGCAPAGVLDQAKPPAGGEAAAGAAAADSLARAAAERAEESAAPESLAAVPRVPPESAAAKPAAQPAEPGGAGPTGPVRRSYTITGDDFQHSRRGQARISTLSNARIASDSLVITADKAERNEDESLRRDEIFLDGDVLAIEGKTRISGEKGHYDRWRDTAEVSGNVRITEPETEITCREAVYERGRQIFLLTGDVRIQQDKETILAQKVVYHRDTSFAEAFVDVELRDPRNQTVLTGEHGSYDRRREIAVMDESPLLTAVEGEGDTVRVRSRTMRQSRADSLAIAVGEVHYTRGETEALCDSALYYQGKDRLKLFGNPRLLKRGSELSGDVLELFFTEGELSRMNIEGNARFQDEPADARVFPTQRSEISGSRFRVLFTEGAIRDVEVIGSPRSVYIPPIGDDGRAALNEVSGDSMLLRFGEGELEEVRIYGSSAGDYRYVDDWRRQLAAADSSLADSLAPAADFAAKASGIKYKAKDITYDALKDRVYLEGEAEVESEDFILRAKSIRYDAGEDMLDARGEPLLIDKEERLYGSLMEYDIAGRKGLVYDGATRYGEGYYTGKRLKKVDEDVLNATASTYTSCDLAQPHYHFEFDRMTIRVKDKIVGGPVRCYLGNVPVFYLPFIFSNLERGRRSGFLQPDFEFGISFKENKPRRFVRDLGYYWAISDYADLKIQGDFVEKSSIYGSLSYKYYRRYFLDGSLSSSLSYDVNQSLVNDSFSWGLRGNHNQSFGERSTLSANIDFVSSENLREIDHYTIEQTINQRLSSSVGFTRKWDSFSLNSSYSRTQILNQEDADPATNNLLLDEKVPVSVSATSIPLWPGGAQSGGIRGALAQLKIQPNLRYSRSMKTYEAHREVSESASTGSSLSYNLKLGFLNLRPSVSASESWSRSDKPVLGLVSIPYGKGDPPAGGPPVTPDGETLPLNTAQRESVAGGEFSHNWSASSSASTRFYGIFYPRIGRLTGLRHTLAPSVSWQYSETRAKTFSLSRNLRFSLDNALDLKFGEGEKAERKTGIVNWSLNTSYDLKKEVDPWGSLTSSLRFAPIGGLSMQIGHTYDLNNSRKVSSSLSGSYNLSGAFGYGQVEHAEAKQNLVRTREGGLIEEEKSSGSEIPPGGEGETDEFDPLAPLAPPRGGGILGGAQTWNLGLSFSLYKTESSRPSPTVSIGSRISLTENWQVDYRTNLRLEDGELGSQTINVTRDLHCWAATFSRLVFQGREQYYFRIYLKAHPEDIKIESGDRGMGYGSF